MTLILYKLASLTGRIQAENLVLLVCSLAFYAWGGVRYLALLLALILLNWGAGLLMERTNRRRLFLALGVGADLLALMICKYFNFFVDNVQNLAGSLGRKSRSACRRFRCPLGFRFLPSRSCPT